MMELEKGQMQGKSVNKNIAMQYIQNIQFKTMNQKELLRP